jgi:hypothetical protein
VIVSAGGGKMWSSDEKRSHVRYTYIADMEYMLKTRATDEILQGAVVNVSNSGMSLFVTKPLDIGQEITIKSNLPNLAQTAVVRWIKQVGGCYKIGAECNDLG